MAIEDLLRRYGMLSEMSEDQTQNQAPTSVKATGGFLPGLLGNTELLMGLGLLGAASKGQNIFEAALPSLYQAGQIQQAFSPKKQFETLTPEQIKGTPGLDPTRLYQRNAQTGEIKQVGTSPLVQISPGETEEQKVVGKARGMQFEEIIKSQDTANKENVAIQSIEQILATTPDLKTGFGTGVATGLEKSLNYAGIKTNLQNVPAAEALANASGQLVMNTLGQFKGAISDGERAFAVSINPGLGTSKQGIQAQLEIKKSINRIADAYANEARDWSDRNVTLSSKDKLTGESWSEFTKNWQKENPLFTDETKEKLKTLTGQIDPDFANTSQYKLKSGRKVIKSGDKYYYAD